MARGGVMTRNILPQDGMTGMNRDNPLKRAGNEEKDHIIRHCPVMCFFVQHHHRIGLA
jgi:hypothetical protein